MYAKPPQTPNASVPNTIRKTVAISSSVAVDPVVTVVVAPASRQIGHAVFKKLCQEVCADQCQQERVLGIL